MSSSHEMLTAHMQAAEAYAGLSKARRRKVGAVLTRDNRIVSVGYNGTVGGSDNNCELNGITKPEVIHAEMNAIAFAAKSGITTDGCEMVITLSPCFDCARIIIQSGVKTVHYRDTYTDTSGIEFLNAHGVTTTQLA